jgi:hypothetical protein
MAHVVCGLSLNIRAAAPATARVHTVDCGTMAQLRGILPAPLSYSLLLTWPDRLPPRQKEQTFGVRAETPDESWRTALVYYIYVHTLGVTGLYITSPPS